MDKFTLLRRSERVSIKQVKPLLRNDDTFLLVRFIVADETLLVGVDNQLLDLNREDGRTYVPKVFFIALSTFWILFWEIWFQLRSFQELRVHGFN